jgi:hypothetical protein
VKSLLIITVLVSSISVSSGALSSERMSLYTQTGTVPELAGEVQGSYVEKDHMDFYIVPIVPVETQKPQAPLLIAESGDSESPTEYINVFGVKVPTKI